jgi:hypothetical protein
VLFRSPFSFHEDTAGNGFYVFFIMISLILYLLGRSKEWDISLYIISLFVAFLFFCTYLKWQPWNSRLQLPLFVLYAPIIGLMLSRTRYRKLSNTSVVLLIIMAIPWIFLNSSRPIVGNHSILKTSRIEQYFFNQPSLARPYFESTHILADMRCSDVGLVAGPDDWEYPFWVLLQENTNKIVYIENVNVTNISQQKYDGNNNTSNLCAIIVMNADPPVIKIGENSYARNWSSDSVSLYIRTDSH